MTATRDPGRAAWTMQLQSDERLAARTVEGDRAAFAELYRRHHQRVYRYCLGLLGDADDAADVLQTTMARALTSLEGGEAVRGVRAWLFRIAHNCSIDLVRSRRPRAPLEELEETESSRLTAPSAASDAMSRADFAQAIADLRNLPGRQQSALVMRELSELSYNDIGRALETSPLAARQLVHQARSLLHDTRDGREMDCETAQKDIGDAEGKKPRDRRVRAHLAECEECTRFQRSIRRRRSALAAVAPPLAPAAASEILGRLLDGGAGSGAGAAAGGGATAGLAKLAGASTATKLAVAAAAAGTAVVAAGGIVAAGGLLGEGDAPGVRGVTPSFIQPPRLPPLHELPKPSGPSPGAAALSDRRDRTVQASSTSTPAPSASSPRLSTAALERRGPVSRAALSVPDRPRVVESVSRRVPSLPSSVSIPATGRRVSVPRVRVPDVSPNLPSTHVNLPSAPVNVPSGGQSVPRVQVPQVNIPPVDVPPVHVPPIQVPGGTGTTAPGSGGTPGTGVSVPSVPSGGGSVTSPTQGSGSQVSIPQVSTPTLP